MFPAATTVTAARNVNAVGFWPFLSSFSSSVKSRYVFSRSVKVNRDRGSTAHYGLAWMIVRFLTACHVLLGPLTFSYVPTTFVSSATTIEFCQGILRWILDNGLCLSPFVPTVWKWGQQSCCSYYILTLWSENIINVNEEACFEFIALLSAYTLPLW